MACSVKELGNIVRNANLAAFRDRYWKPKRSSFDLEGASKKMTKFVEEAFNRQTHCNDLSEIYQACYYVMIYDFGDELSQKLTDEIENYLSSAVMVKIQRSFADGFLTVLKNQWNEFKCCMNRINTAFLHYNDLLAKKSNKDKAIDLGLKKFRDFIVCNHEVTENLQTNLLQLIADHRVKCRVETSSLEFISTACKMLNELTYENDINVYESIFEQAFLNQSSCHYKKLSDEKIKASSAIEYISFVEYHIKAEQARNELYTTEASVEKNRKVLEKELIEKHLDEIVSSESGADYMLSKDLNDQLGSMYSTLSRVDGGLQPLIGCVKTYLYREGTAIMKEDDKKQASSVIQNLIKLKDRLDGFVTNCFKSDNNFNKAVNTMYEKVINEFTTAAPFLSIYIDMELRKVSKENSDVDLSDTFDKALTVFDYMNDKDYFEKMFKGHLSKRLTADKTSIDHEKKLIEKLKIRCGTSMTRVFEGMLKDLEVSAGVNEEFRSNHKRSGKIDLSVTVLTSSLWPKQDLCKPILPRTLLDSFQLFDNFYTRKFQGRKLTQLNDRGEGEVNFFSLTKKSNDKVLVVNSLQMIVLMLFNQQLEMTTKQIEAETKIPLKLLTIVLKSLTKPLTSKGSNVLKSLSGSKNILESDSFSVNEQFTHQRKRVKIPISMPKLGETKKGRQGQKKKIDQDRKFEIDAAVVRIMKGKKKAKHQILIAAIIEQLSHRFKPDVKVLKGRIEYLIEQKYLERDTSDRSTYKYLA